MTCGVAGCSRSIHAHGWCNPHYKRWRRYGDPEYVTAYGPRTVYSKPLEVRFWEELQPKAGALAGRTQPRLRLRADRAAHVG